MPRPSVVDSVIARLAAVRLSAAAAVLGTAIVLVLALGCVAQFVLPWGSPGYALLNMDGERSVPAVFSGGLLLVGGLLALFAAPRGLPYRLLGLGLAFAALDEVFALHELLQRATGINWIKLYLPVFLAAAVVAVLLVRALRTDAPAAIRPLVAGTGAWAAAQLLEWAEWLGTDVPQPGYVPMVLAEETLENAGSALFVLALLKVAQGARDGRSDRPVASARSRGLVATESER